MIKAIIFGVIIYFAYKTIKSFMMKEMLKNQDVSGQAPGELNGNLMLKDPMCGVYFPEKDGVVLKKGQEKLVFCSEKCREDYQAGKKPMHS